MENQVALSPHVLIFPLPLQGPVNSMLKLAELLCFRDLQVTFLNTEHVQQRLLSHSDVESHFKRYPKFRFETIADGLPEDNPRTASQIRNLVYAMEIVTKPLLTEMVTSGSLGSMSEKPLTCIIADGIFCFAVDVAREIGVPLIYFDTISPCGLWTYLCLPKLIEAGELPFCGSDLDKPIRSVPGMEGIVRRRDLPSFCRVTDLNDLLIQLVLKEDMHLPLAQGLIFNTFEDLEGPIIRQMQTVCSNVYAIGPLHAHVQSRVAAETATPNKAAASHGLWQEDSDCLNWLDKQPPKSAVYVSIGSLAVITTDQLMEIWHGLVNSEARFLWVHRPGSITGLDEIKIPAELSIATEKRGCIVSWAPQEKVLGHQAIGGFLTHSGWNSTLESIVAGVPMICWPYFVDQQVNSRYVEVVWKLGLDMKDTCERGIVERMIREVMDVRRVFFQQRAGEMEKLAKASVGEGGASYNDLDRLIEDIRLMRLKYC